MNTLTAYLGAVLGVLAIGCGSIVTMEIARPDGINTQASYMIVGVCTTVLTVLLGIIKANSGTQEVKQAAVEAKQTAAVVADVAARTAANVPAATARATAAAVEDVLTKTLPRP